MRRLLRTEERGVQVFLAICLLVLAATALFVQDNRANSTSRLALTAALAEQGTVVIDDYEATLDVDRAEKDGHLYSDKAPGQAVAAVPFWAVYRAAGGDPGTEPRLEGHLGHWWISVWFSAVPGALLCGLMYRYAAGLVGQRRAVAAALGLFFGSILLPFSTMLFGHTLAGLLLMVAFLHARSATPGTDTRALVLAGLASAAAVSVEYTVGMVVAVLLVAVAVRHRTRAVWFLVGAVPPAVFVAGYHTVTFGGPLEHPYKYSVFQVHHDSFAGIGMPDLGLLVEVLVGERGLLTLTPVVAVAIAGLIHHRKRLSPFDVGVPLSILAVYLLFASGWVDATGGWSPGTRHLLPAIPFLIGGLALAWDAWPKVTLAASAWSALVMTLATVTDPQVPDTVSSALRFWVDHVADGDFARTILSPVLGRAGLIVVGLAVLTAALHVVERERRDPVGSGAGQSRRLEPPSQGAAGTSGPGSRSGGSSNR